MNPFLNQQNSLINNNQINPYLSQFILNESQMNPFLYQQNSMLNNLMMMNNNPMMMNNPMMINNNPMMMNNNPMMMNNQMMMNNPMMINNNPMMMNINMNNNNNNLGESNDDINLNYENLNEVQKNLINQIIKFYQENGCSEMNLQNKNQIKQLIKQINPHTIGKENETYFYCDEFNYIKREKKIIKFVTSDFKILYIKIPTFITKFDLYSIAGGKKVFQLTNFLLIHNNKILNKDDSSIDGIIDNDFVMIIENRLYPNKSAYINLQNRYPLNDILSLIVVFDNGKQRNYNLSREVTIQEFLSMVIKENGLFERDTKFIHNSQIININSFQKIKESGLNDKSNIFCIINHLKAFNYYGKVIKGETINKSEIPVFMGTLNKISFIFNELISYGNIRCITIGNIRLNKNSDNCLFLYGIKDNFYFSCEMEDGH